MSPWAQRWKYACKHFDKEKGNKFSRQADPLVQLWLALHKFVESKPEDYPLLRMCLMEKSVDGVNVVELEKEISKSELPSEDWKRAFGDFSKEESTVVSDQTRQVPSSSSATSGKAKSKVKDQKRLTSLFRWLEDYQSENFHIENKEDEIKVREKVDALKEKSKEQWTDEDIDFVEQFQMQYQAFSGRGARIRKKPKHVL